MCQFVCNRDLSVLTLMPFDGTSSGGKCYGAGRRRLSFGSFQKGLENRERTEKQWNQQHNRISAKKPIHEVWERNFTRASRPLLVGFLSRYSDILSGFLRSGILCEIDSDLFVFSYQDSCVNMIGTRI